MGFSLVSYISSFLTKTQDQSKTLDISVYPKRYPIIEAIMSYFGQTIDEASFSSFESLPGIHLGSLVVIDVLVLKDNTVILKAKNCWDRSGPALFCKLYLLENVRRESKFIQGGSCHRAMNYQPFVPFYYGQFRNLDRTTLFHKDMPILKELSSSKKEDLESFFHKTSWILDNWHIQISEFVEGIDLYEYVIRRQKKSTGMVGTGLKYREIQFITSCLGSIIESLHASKIAHRDLKLENVIVSQSGYLKLIDFDFSVNYCSEEEPCIADGCGSPDYAAPEIWDYLRCKKEKIEKKVDPFSTDIWSLGVMLYAICLGKLPFKITDIEGRVMDNAFEIIQSGAISWYEFASLHNGMILKSSLMKLLEFHPEKRILASQWRSLEIFEGVDCASYSSEKRISPLDLSVITY